MRLKQAITLVAPHLAEAVLGALHRAPLEGLSVQEVRGYGRQKNYLDQYQDGEFADAFVPKVEITLWVDESRLDDVLDKITAVTRTGCTGDGKVLITPVDRML